jgi:hypothetical protein
MDLVFWKEKGLSDADQAERRYRQILFDDERVPLGELDSSLREFVEEVERRLPEVRTVPDEHSIRDAGYSRSGIIFRIEELTLHRELDLIAHQRGLTMYNPEMRMVIGRDDSIDIEIIDNE